MLSSHFQAWKQERSDRGLAAEVRGFGLVRSSTEFLVSLGEILSFFFNPLCLSARLAHGRFGKV